MLPSVAECQAREAVTTQPQTKLPAATHGLLQLMPAVWSTPMGAERRVQQDDEPQGVERFGNDQEGTCLALRSRLLSFNRARNSVRCDLGLCVC